MDETLLLPLLPPFLPSPLPSFLVSLLLSFSLLFFPVILSPVFSSSPSSSPSPFILSSLPTQPPFLLKSLTPVICAPSAPGRPDAFLLLTSEACSIPRGTPVEETWFPGLPPKGICLGTQWTCRDPVPNGKKFGNTLNTHQCGKGYKSCSILF